MLGGQCSVLGARSRLEIQCLETPTSGQWLSLVWFWSFGGKYCRLAGVTVKSSQW